ncbi:hypothetical protein F0562_024082 [Nyssa sinensis]|uniref:Nascent polypeptide-associated complex subunit beta n=1 Tax=Nyssa sinensis TaxID=561372 RepID=A0A5J5BL28_9ASTE|nr:hypothetical protein F0562_024082 [Nyssa sinensis]
MSVVVLVMEMETPSMMAVVTEVETLEIDVLRGFAYYPITPAVALLLLLLLLKLFAPTYYFSSTPELAEMNVEKLMKMAGAVRTGGKGSMRRKKKAVHKTTTTDDKRLQSTLKRIGVNAIPAIEEVNIFADDVVIQFINPKGKTMVLTSISILYSYASYPLSYCASNKCFSPFHISVQASIPANTWVVSGSPQTKSMISSLLYAIMFVYLHYLLQF